MAPTFVQVHHNYVEGASSVTVASLDVGSGANRSLVAVVGWRDQTGASAPTGSSVVFNTTESFTYRSRASINWATDNYLVCEIWTLDNPSNATANVVATISEINDAGDPLALIVMEFTGANNGVGANFGSATGISTAPSCTFTTGLSTSLIVGGFAQEFAATSATPGTNVTERDDYLAGTGVPILVWAGTKAASGGSDTINATSDASSRWAIAAIELKEAAGAAAGNPWYAYAQQ